MFEFWECWTSEAKATLIAGVCAIFGAIYVAEVAFSQAVQVESKRANRIQKERQLNELASIYAKLHFEFARWMSAIQALKIIVDARNSYRDRLRLVKAGKAPQSEVDQRDLLEGTFARKEEQVQRMQDRLILISHKPQALVHQISFLEVHLQRREAISEIKNWVEEVRTRALPDKTFNLNIPILRAMLLFKFVNESIAEDRREFEKQAIKDARGRIKTIWYDLMGPPDAVLPPTPTPEYPKP